MADSEIRNAVRPWIDLIDTLRAQGVHQDLPLPQIAVPNFLMLMLALVYHSWLAAPFAFFRVFCISSRATMATLLSGLLYLR